MANFERPENNSGNQLSLLTKRFLFSAYVAIWRLIGRNIFSRRRGKKDPFLVFHDAQVFRFVVNDVNEHISRKLWRRRTFYERHMLEHAANRLSSGSVAVDVGANIGNHTVFFAGVCRMAVVACEPNPEALSMLRENISINDLSETVTVEACALGQFSGLGEIDSLPANIGAAKVAKAEDGSIAIRTLDDVVGSLEVGLIKIDVEGMELEVILGAQRTIKRCQPLLYIECKDVPAALTIQDELSKFGYLPQACFNASATVLFAPKATVLADLIESRER